MYYINDILLCLLVLKMMFKLNTSRTHTVNKEVCKEMSSTFNRACHRAALLYQPPTHQPGDPGGYL